MEPGFGQMKIYIHYVVVVWEMLVFYGGRLRGRRSQRLRFLSRDYNFGGGTGGSFAGCACKKFDTIVKLTKRFYEGITKSNKYAIVILEEETKTNNKNNNKFNNNNIKHIKDHPLEYTVKPLDVHHLLSSDDVHNDDDDESISNIYIYIYIYIYKYTLGDDP